MKRILTSDGRLAIDVARENGIKKSTLFQRIRAYGWEVDRACTQTRNQRIVHNSHGTPLYNRWHGMIQRTTLGGCMQRGNYLNVRCDSRWSTFQGFLDNQPQGRGYEVGLVLSRVGDVGDYTPENCRWITKSENSRENVERKMRKTSDGRFALDVARENGIKESTMKQRINKHGWSVDRACTQTEDGRKTAERRQEISLSRRRKS